MKKLLLLVSVCFLSSTFAAEPAKEKPAPPEADQVKSLTAKVASLESQLAAQKNQLAQAQAQAEQLNVFLIAVKTQRGERDDALAVLRLQQVAAEQRIAALQKAIAEKEKAAAPAAKPEAPTSAAK